MTIQTVVYTDDETKQALLMQFLKENGIDFEQPEALEDEDE